MKKLVAVLTVLLFGCSTITSHTEFKEKRTSLSDSEVCRTLIHSYENSNYTLYADALSEAMNRNQTYNTCKQKINNQTAILAALAIGTVAVVAAKNSGGGGGYAPVQQQAQDFQWAWDEFYNEYRQLVWRCRGMQTGQFAPDDKCMLKLKIDNTWPAKENF